MKVIDIKQLSIRLQPLIQQARNEKKVLFHPKAIDENGKPKFVPPEDLEKYTSRYPYEKEEWKLVDPHTDPQVHKTISEMDEGHRERSIFELEKLLKEKKETKK